MKTIKSVREIATNAGFPNEAAWYPAACGVFIAKMESIKHELDRLRSNNDPSIQDYQASIEWMSQIVDTLFKEEDDHDSK